MGESGRWVKVVGELMMRLSGKGWVIWKREMVGG